MDDLGVHFLRQAFERVGLDWHDYVDYDVRFRRPHDVSHLLGNATKAERVLGWRPRKSFADLVSDMVEADLSLFGELG